MAREKRIKHEWQESSLDFCSVEGWSAEQQALEYARTALGSMGYAKCTIDGKPAEIFGLMIKYRTTRHTEETKSEEFNEQKASDWARIAEKALQKDRKNKLKLRLSLYGY